MTLVTILDIYYKSNNSFLYFEVQNKFISRWPTVMQAKNILLCDQIQIGSLTDNAVHKMQILNVLTPPNYSYVLWVILYNALLFRVL